MQKNFADGGITAMEHHRIIACDESRNVHCVAALLTGTEFALVSATPSSGLSRLRAAASRSAAVMSADPAVVTILLATYLKCLACVRKSL